MASKEDDDFVLKLRLDGIPKDEAIRRLESAKVNTDMKVARENTVWQDFFADVGSYKILPERSTGGTYYTVEDMYRFFKERMHFETTKVLK